MLIYAHRGASAQYPENTMLAFEKAMEMGAAGIETDVHLSRDGQLVLCHDETIDGTTDRSGWIARLTYDELLRADAGVRRGAQFAGQRIPLLRDLLKLARESGIALNLELKNYVLDYPDLERLVIEEIRKYLRPERVLLSSFRHLSLVRAKQMAPETPTGLLYGCDLYRPAEYAAACGANALHPDYTMLSAETMREAKRAGLQVNVWTVDDPADMLRMRDMGVDVLMTNRPQTALRVLKEADRQGEDA